MRDGCKRGDEGLACLVGRTPDLMLWLEKQFGKKITTRTWKTVGKILAKMG